jgi:hypothetical protein
MLIRTHQLNHWQRMAYGCSFGAIMALAWVWAGVDSAGLKFPLSVFLIAPALSAFFLVCGWFFEPPNRLKFVALMLGAFGFFPLYLFTVSPVLVLIIVPWMTLPMKLGLSILFLAVNAYWSHFKFRRIREVLARSRYFSRELNPLPGGGYVIDGDRARDLEKIADRLLPKININTRWMIPIVTPLVSMGPVLQRVLVANRRTQGGFYCARRDDRTASDLLYGRAVRRLLCLGGRRSSI